MILADALIDKIVSATDGNSDEVRFFLNNFINETRVALKLLKPYLDHQLTFLEMGSGLGFFSLFLRSENYKVTALEPVAGGFDRFSVAKEIILSHYSGLDSALDLLVLDKKAHELDPQVDGHFDVVFSNNVIEHIPELTQTLKALADVLSPQDRMVHGCPNYIVPYEPHLQIPVMGCWPRASEIVYREKVNNMADIWQSLNFSTYFDVRRFARHNKMNLDLRKGLIHQAFLRLESAPYFSSRQKGSAFSMIYKCLKVSGLLSLLKLWPPAFSKLMIFELRQ
ncbi:MAG: class I SAM-dependent methyltransferase [Colwellia sp.]|jgi:Methyltransferase domain.